MAQECSKVSVICETDQKIDTAAHQKVKRLKELTSQS